MPLANQRTFRAEVPNRPNCRACGKVLKFWIRNEIKCTPERYDPLLKELEQTHYLVSARVRTYSEAQGGKSVVILAVRKDAATFGRGGRGYFCNLNCAEYFANKLALDGWVITRKPPAGDAGNEDGDQ